MFIAVVEQYHQEYIHGPPGNIIRKKKMSFGCVLMFLISTCRYNHNIFAESGIMTTYAEEIIDMCRNL